MVLAGFALPIYFGFEFLYVCLLSHDTLHVY